MTKTKPGTRVGAMVSITETEVRFLGFGTYQGVNPVPGRSPGWSSPEILLDNGDTVYGYECWWDGEDSVRRVLQGKIVIPVTITSERMGQSIHQGYQTEKKTSGTTRSMTNPKTRKPRPYNHEHLAALSSRAYLHRESYRTQKPSDIREAVPAADHYEVVQRFLDTLQQTRSITLNEVTALLDKEWTAARGRYESNPTVEREAYCIAARDLLLTVRALHTKSQSTGHHKDPFECSSCGYAPCMCDQQ